MISRQSSLFALSGVIGMTIGILLLQLPAVVGSVLDVLEVWTGWDDLWENAGGLGKAVLLLSTWAPLGVLYVLVVHSPAIVLVRIMKRMNMTDPTIRMMMSRVWLGGYLVGVVLGYALLNAGKT